MFAISARSTYGLTALFEMGLNYNKGSIQIKDIASGHGIPQHYLEQLLVSLKKAGFVESFRGSQGGYALAKHPGLIKVLDILICLDGRLELVPEGKRDGVLNFFWTSLEGQISNLFDMSLEELILQQQSFDRQLNYHI